MKAIKTLLTNIFALATIGSFAQINISHPSALKKVIDEGGTTYIVMKNPNAPEVEPYKQVLREYWKITPVEFISVATADKYKTDNGAFMFWEDMDVSATNNSDLNRYGLHLTLFVGKSLKDLGVYNVVNAVARLRVLYTTQGASRQKSNDDGTVWSADFNFDGEGNLFSWGPGVFKNYIQAIQLAVENNQEVGTASIAKKSELTKLKSRVLFVPDYASMIGEKIFKDYPYKHNIVSINETNTKILEGKEFYYLLFYLSPLAQKQVIIWNSKTGEIVYLDSFTYVGTSLFNAKDLKKIQKAIEE